MEVTPYDLDLIRSQPGFEDFSCHEEVLDLLKPVYGLRDAPRCWQTELKLQALMQKCGLQQSLCDSQLYVLRLGSLTGNRHSQAAKQLKTTNQQAVVLAGTVHVDDIKVTGIQCEADLLASKLESEVGKLKKQRGTFMHVGLNHHCTDEGILVEQYDFTRQLQLMNTDSVQQLKCEDEVDEETRSRYMSLLGALSWLAQSRPDAAVHILAYNAMAPSHGRYCKKKATGIYYPKLEASNYSLLTFSDSAFRAKPEESSGLALKGSVTLLMKEEDLNKPSIHGKCHVLDFSSARQRRVMRSTFGAEVNAAMDASERTYGLQLRGNVRDLQAIFDAGALQPKVYLAIDAKSVFDCVACKDYHAPSEDSLALHVLALRSDLSCGKLKGFLWCDTRSMLADPLTKGSADKTMLMRATHSGMITISAEQLQRHTISR
eukprot:6460551-Amphidinium_carterae.7